MDEVSQLLQDQDGVVSRRQLVAAGTTRTALARLLRRGELVVAVPGVYVEHNGPLTWQQRAWVAVLHAWPAALCLDSALRAAEGPGRRDRDDTTIHVAVDGERRVSAAPGSKVHRTVALEDRVQWNRSPPRLHYEDALLDVAAAARDDLAAVAVLADACGGRRTTAARLFERLETRQRIARREWLTAVLTDVATGTCSVLEHGYLTRVVRPHGLPVGVMQAARVTSAGSVLRDVEHPDLDLAVELDGRLFHTSAGARDADVDRDLDAAAEAGLATVRLGFGQVFRSGCRTAAQVARVMQRHGWAGQPRCCPQCGGSDQPG